MTIQVMLHYLVDGKPVGKIAEELKMSRAEVRRHLKNGGVFVRLMGGTYHPGRDAVCESVRRTGFSSFHAFALVNSLEPITEQATSLGVTKKSLTRVYNAYRKLLTSLKGTGIVLPTSQTSGVDLERQARGT
jgi:hypothetical protein